MVIGARVDTFLGVKFDLVFLRSLQMQNCTFALHLEHRLVGALLRHAATVADSAFDALAFRTILASLSSRIASLSRYPDTEADSVCAFGLAVCMCGLAKS